ncbi:hypothetical protein [Trinickia fusca]|uniref:Uncharacterized protein n=1 Tax=Trinickia fusca TaxID=2419777 RepID=A0A494XC88_9BURK|nr:hypothetical protein [Trinickia fusca]RKP47552.1 hypothetical protein D7S89_15100 [Trinickia fusca]
MSGQRNDGDVAQRRQKNVVFRLELEDQGQRLTTLYVIDGVIVYSGLIQRLVWEQRRLSTTTFSVGDIVELGGDREDGLVLRCAVTHVVRIERLQPYRAWLDEVDRLAREQWGEPHYTAKSGANRPGDSWIEAYLDGCSPAAAWSEEVRAAQMWSGLPTFSDTWPVTASPLDICVLPDVLSMTGSDYSDTYLNFNQRD